MATYFLPYNKDSASVKLLKDTSGWKSLNTNGGSAVTSNGHTVIKWGNSSLDNIKFIPKRVFNADVSLVLNKTKFFKHCAGKRWCPEYTHSLDVVYAWLSEGHKVLQRTTASGSGGKGISVITKADQIKHDSKSFFVKYIPKKEEYRVHVVCGNVIEVSKKVMPKGNKPKNGWEVRSHSNGFIFQKNNLGEIPVDVCQVALEAMLQTGLDFGGVDVAWNKAGARAYVLEINSAPGIEGSTVTKYVDAFKKAIG